jgi:hypothetical protein
MDNTMWLALLLIALIAFASFARAAKVLLFPDTVPRDIAFCKDRLREIEHRLFDMQHELKKIRALIEGPIQAKINVPAPAEQRVTTEEESRIHRGNTDADR